MVFSEEDKALIKNLYLIKGYGPQKLMSGFPGKNWKRRGLDELLKKLRKTGTTERRKGSGRPKSARTEANVSAVQELALSQEDQPQTHRSVRQISRETGIPRSSVSHIIHDDLGLKCLKKRRAQELTAHRAHDTLRLLEQATPVFIPPDLWPPNSPDLNPVDYKIWGIMQQRVYQSRVNNVDELKQRLLDVWQGHGTEHH